MAIERADWNVPAVVDDQPVVPATHTPARYEDSSNGVLEPERRSGVPGDFSGSGASGLPLTLESMWRNDPAGYEFRLRTAQQSAMEVLAESHEPDELVRGFDTLPEAVHTAVFSEISHTPSGAAKRASDAEMRDLATDPGLAYLIDRWGHNAPKKCGLILQRIRNIGRQLSDADKSKLQHWFDGLDAKEAAGIYLMLAGGTG